MLFHVFTLPGPALTLSHYFQALHCDTAPEGVPTVLSSPLRWGYAISSLRLAHWGLGQGSRCLSAGGRPAGPGGRPGNPGRPPWCDCGRAGSGRGPPRRRSRCGGCSDTPWNSCGRRSRSGSGSGRAPHTSRSRNPGRTLGGTAPSRCGEGVGVRAGKQPPPPQGRPGWRQGPHSFSEPTPTTHPLLH